MTVQGKFSDVVLNRLTIENLSHDKLAKHIYHCYSADLSFVCTIEESSSTQ